MNNRIIFLLAAVLTSVSVQAQETPSQSIIDISSMLTIDQLAKRVAQKRVVYVSETHTDYAHHLNQLEIIKSQHQRHDNLAIGVEFIQQPFQSVLDDFIAGRIDEAAMLKGTQYFERWSYDYRLYRPIFSFAREHGIPVIALNIDKDIIDRVKVEGLQNVTQEISEQLPDEINRDDEAYRARLQKVYDQHPHGDDDTFESFVDIQLLWDESMAQTASEWLQQNPDGHMVILAGSGHIAYGSGIPNRIQRRVPVSSASIINISRDSSFDPDMGDFVVITSEQSLPPAGKLGVILDSSDSPPRVTAFTPHSEARPAGVKEDDQIIAIDDNKITSYSDIRLAIMDKSVNQTVKVKVRRDRLFFDPKEYEFEVTLK